MLITQLPPVNFVFIITLLYRNLPLQKLHMKNILLLLFIVGISTAINAQPNRWQQRVKYVMNVDMNVQTKTGIH